MGLLAVKCGTIVGCHLSLYANPVGLIESGSCIYLFSSDALQSELPDNLTLGSNFDYGR